MESLGNVCTDLKLKYETCFNRWFSEDFLAKGSTEEQPCKAAMAAYRACLQKVLLERSVDLGQLAKAADAQMADATDGASVAPGLQ